MRVLLTCRNNHGRTEPSSFAKRTGRPRPRQPKPPPHAPGRRCDPDRGYSFHRRGHWLPVWLTPQLHRPRRRHLPHAASTPRPQAHRRTNNRQRSVEPTRLPLLLLLLRPPFTCPTLPLCRAPWVQLLAGAGMPATCSNPDTWDIIPGSVGCVLFSFSGVWIERSP